MEKGLAQAKILLIAFGGYFLSHPVDHVRISSLSRLRAIQLTRGLAVASIARDDLSTLPGDDPFPRAHWTINSSVLAPVCTAAAMRGKLWLEFET